MNVESAAYSVTGTAPPARPALDIGRVLRDSWTLFFKDIGPLVVAALIPGAIFMILYVFAYVTFFVPFWAGAGSDNKVVVGALLTWFAVIGGIAVIAGIALTPMYAGMYQIVFRRVREGRRATFGDIWACYGRFVSLVLSYVALSFLIFIGFVFFVVPGVYMAVIWVYAWPLIIDKRMSLGEAMSQSRRMVGATGWWLTFLLLIIIVAIAVAVSSFTGGLVSFLLVPWQFAAVGAMYFAACGEGHVLPSALPAGMSWEGGGRASSPPQWGPAGPPPYGPPPYGPPPYGPPPYGPPPYGPPPYGAPPYGPPASAPPQPPTPPEAPQPPTAT